MSGAAADLGEAFSDLLAATREVLEDFVVDAADLGHAVADGFPFDAERVGEVLAQGGLVEEAGGALVGVEGAAVEGGLAAVSAGGVGNDGVGVQLRVASARGPVPEG